MLYPNQHALHNRNTHTTYYSTVPKLIQTVDVGKLLAVWGETISGKKRMLDSSNRSTTTLPHFSLVIIHIFFFLREEFLFRKKVQC